MNSQFYIQYSTNFSMYIFTIYHLKIICNNKQEPFNFSWQDVRTTNPRLTQGL